MFELLGNFWFLLFGMIAVIAIAEAWQKVRRGEQETELKRDMLQRGLSVEEMERVLRAGSGKHKEPKAKSGRDERIVERLAAHLGKCQASGPVIDEVLTTVRAADSAGKLAIERAVQGLICGSSDGEIKEERDPRGGPRFLPPGRRIRREPTRAAADQHRHPADAGPGVAADRPGLSALLGDLRALRYNRFDEGTARPAIVTSPRRRAQATAR